MPLRSRTMWSSTGMNASADESVSTSSAVTIEPVPVNSAQPCEHVICRLNIGTSSHPFVANVCRIDADLATGPGCGWPTSISGSWLTLGAMCVSKKAWDSR